MIARKKPAPKSRKPLAPAPEAAAPPANLDRLLAQFERISTEARGLADHNKTLTTIVIELALSLQGVLNGHGCVPGPRECKFCKRARARLAEAAAMFSADVQPTEKAEEPA